MSKKILLSILVVVVALGLVGVGTYALWSDSATSAGNKFESGSLDLSVAGQFVATNMYPGATATATYVVNNDGSIPGTLSAKCAFAGSATLLNELELLSVKVDGGPELIVPGEAVIDFDEVIGVLPAHSGHTVDVKIGMKSSATGAMNQSVTGDIIFTLDQIVP